MLVRLGYRNWSGHQRRWIPWWPIARSGIRLVLRRRVFWLFLLLGLMNFLFHFALVYFMAQLEAEVGQRGGRLPPFVREATFTGTGKSYRDFIAVQGTVVMVLLGFAGSILVGNDFRHGSLPFYLSKPTGKRGYFLGKLAAASGLTALITLIPALVLYVEYGLFTESLEYFVTSRRILLAILGYGALVSLLSGVVLLGTAALLRRTILIVVVWGGIFVFLPMVAEILEQVAMERGSAGWYWKLLDFWWLLRRVSDVMFGIEAAEGTARLPLVLAVLALWVGASLAIFRRCVRAVEVVR